MKPCYKCGTLTESSQCRKCLLHEQLEKRGEIMDPKIREEIIEELRRIRTGEQINK